MTIEKSGMLYAVKKKSFNSFISLNIQYLYTELILEWDLSLWEASLQLCDSQGFLT